MRTTLLAAGLLSSAFVASVVMAQGQPATPPAGNAQPPTGSTDNRPADNRFITQEGSQGVLRLSDIIGRNAVGTDNKTIGKVGDVVLGRDGNVAAYIVDVGGALGLGSRAVAVPAQSVQIEPIDTTATTGTVQSQGLPASTAEGQKARSEMQISRVLSPGKIVVTIPADQLKSAPAYGK